MGKRSNLLVVVGLAVFVLGGAIVMLVLRSNDGGTPTQQLAASGQSVAVVVATKDIPAGTSGGDMITQGMVATQSVAPNDRPADAVVSSGQLAGQANALPIKKGETLRTGILRPETIKIPAGKQAVAVQVDFVPGVAGQVNPGDLVNIFANVTKSTDPKAVVPFTRLLLSNVEVLKVSQAPAPPVAATPTTVNPQLAPVAASGQPLVFLVALDANQAEKLIFSTANANQRLYASIVPKGEAPAATPGRDDATLFGA